MSVAPTPFTVFPYKIRGILKALRRPGESDFETAERLIVHESLEEAAGNQKQAAAATGVSARVFNYKCGNFQLRGVDKREKP